jgi:hypothetical protein
LFLPTLLRVAAEEAAAAAAEGSEAAVAPEVMAAERG